MTHRAESIVAAVTTTVTGLVTTGANVYRGRLTPIPVGVNNALKVYLGPDEFKTDLSQTLQDWELTIYIDSFTRSPTAQIDTQLNKIREEVTVALNANYTQGLSYVLNTAEGDADAPELSGEAAQASGGQRLAWKFHYRRSRTNPGA